MFSYDMSVITDKTVWNMSSMTAKFNNMLKGFERVVLIRFVKLWWPFDLAFFTNLNFLGG